MEIKPGWTVKGVYNEACAAEGHCPFYFGRAVENGCRYFMVFRITEGVINSVDLAGTTVIYTGDILHSSFEELMQKGSEGGIYINDNASAEQRTLLDPFVRQEIGGHIMKTVYGLRYVPIDITEKQDTFTIEMPYGAMQQTKTRNPQGDPVVIHNTLLPFLGPVESCHTDFWHIKDYNRHFEYTNRCGSWSHFAFQG